MRTIAVVNQKGGCGKTTTAINLGAAFAEAGKHVLLVDFDPQAHTTIGLGYDPDSFQRTIYDFLTRSDCVLPDIVLQTQIEGLTLAPCNVLLASAERRLNRFRDKELLLGRGLDEGRHAYDVCVIDCPPALGTLTLNALVASTEIIVPVQVHYFALEGLKRLLETIGIIRDRFHPQSMEKIHLLLTFVESQRTFSKQIQQQMRDIFGDLVFDAVIHRDIRLAESPSAGEPVLTYAPRSRGAQDYRAVVREILDDAPVADVEIDSPTRRGIQKHLHNLFEGVWIPHRPASIDPSTIEST